MELKINPEYANKIPPLTDEEFEQLENNILSDGIIINPIIVWRGEIVDGHNRYRIIMKHPELQFSVYEKEFPDGYAVCAWICRNQLGRRNLTPEQRRYLIGKQYDSEKLSHGGNRGNQHGKVASSHGGNLPNSVKTCERIAQENGIGRNTVLRSAAYAKAVDYADEVEPGFRNELLAGKIKATLADAQEIVRASPEDRAKIVQRLRSPEEKKKAREEAAAISRIAKEMEIDTGVGNMDSMLCEMREALDSMIFRWDFCKEQYAQFFSLDECQKIVLKLIDHATNYLSQFKGGLSNGKHT